MKWLLTAISCLSSIILVVILAYPDTGLIAMGAFAGHMMPAISFIGRAQNSGNSSSTSITVNFTSLSPHTGDFLLLYQVASGSTPACPTSWTLVSCGSISGEASACYHIQQNGDPTSVTTGTLAFPKAIVRDYRNVSATTPTDLCATLSPTTGTSGTLPALSAPSHSIETYVGFWANDHQNSTITSTTGDLTHTTADGNQWATFEGDKVITTAPGTEVASLSVSSTWAGYALTLVPTSTSTPSGTFLQFSRNGNILTSYTSGSSLWTRSAFYTDAPSLGGDTPLSDIQKSAINVWEEGNLAGQAQPIYQGCSSSTFAISGGSGTCGNFGAFIDSIFPSRVSATQATNMPFLERTDDFNYFDPTNGSPSQTWGLPAVQRYEQDIVSYLIPVHGIVGTISPDEVYWPASTGWQAIMSYLIPQPPSQSHAVFGVEPNVSEMFNCWGSSEPLCIQWGYQGDITQGWLSQATHSEFFVPETSNSASTSDILYRELSIGDELLGKMTSTRGAVPVYMEAIANGPSYIKTSNNHQFTAGQDIGSPFGTSPGLMVDQIFFAVAHGYQGIRFYAFDHATEAEDRFNDQPATATNFTCSGGVCTCNVGGCGCSGGTGTACLEQTGMSPASAISPGYAGGAYGLGQDRWYGMSAGFNVVQMLEPYILQPNITPPTESCAATCVAQGANPDREDCTCTGPPIITGAKQGNGGKLVVIINFSDSSNSYTYNPSSYITGSNAQAWQIVGSNNHGCGTENTGAAQDCGIGPTTINGTTWGPSSTTVPAAGTAPTATSCGSISGTESGGQCTWTMQPAEVDVFLYH